MQVDRAWHPALKKPAMSQYRASSPNLLAWFKKFNEGNDYRKSVKPFNFLLTLFAGSDSLMSSVKAVAPYDKDRDRAIRKAFHRLTAQKINRKDLQSYAQALMQYHLHPESKFHRGDFVDQGQTSRRHVNALGLRYIGKEAVRLEERYFGVLEDDAEIEYELQIAPSKIDVEKFQRITSGLPVAVIARQTGLSERHVSNVIKGRAQPSAKVLATLRNVLKSIQSAQKRENDIAFNKIKKLRNMVEEKGLKPTAKTYGVDPSNLRRKINSHFT